VSIVSTKRSTVFPDEHKPDDGDNGHGDRLGNHEPRNGPLPTAQWVFKLAGTDARANRQQRKNPKYEAPQIKLKRAEAFRLGVHALIIGGEPQVRRRSATLRPQGNVYLDRCGKDHSSIWITHDRSSTPPISVVTAEAFCGCDAGSDLSCDCSAGLLESFDRHRPGGILVRIRMGCDADSWSVIFR
jgi:hypothetical protein